MKVLIVGKSGQLGRELQRFAWPASYRVLQTGRSDCDLTDPDRIEQVVRTAAPNLVVNAAAYTSVDRAESEPDLAMRINGEGPAALARACSETGAALVHVSTDYVFDGTKKGAYLENDPVNPLSVYGRTKLMGECAVRELLQDHVVFRTSWVFSSHGNNFVKTMLRLGSRMQTIGVVADQTGAPTSARDIAQAIGAIAAKIAAGGGVWGTFHYAGAEPTTWFGFAQAIFGSLESHAHVKVKPITSADFGSPARRPENSLLDCTRICTAYGIARPSWRSALSDTLVEVSTQETEQ